MTIYVNNYIGKKLGAERDKEIGMILLQEQYCKLLCIKGKNYKGGEREKHRRKIFIPEAGMGRGQEGN